MKTPVRISSHFSTHGPYEIMVIDILTQKFKDSKTDYLEPCGQITFQRNLKDTLPDGCWYGMTFKIETDKPEYIQKMASLSKKISKNSSWDSQPNDILEIINADEHKLFNGEFISKSKEGFRFYKVFVNKSYNSHFVCKHDEKEAQKAFEKHCKKRGIEPSATEQDYVTCQFTIIEF